ncbi:hypothetical protein D9757_011030 [Collybiopsis confluens]|uniref:Protein kinase domain-containing protein n=1 Tax=Collybiopsis confluens TaxID=2823264 RepID=A0A8H5LQJ9_9AGAR|nr:hypothetical protein D9757_011030 [Collybiopsis confluens]
MLSFVGVQHEKGMTLGHGITKRTKAAANNAKTAARKRRSQVVATADKASALVQETRRQAAAYGRALFSAGAIRSPVIALPVDFEASLGSHCFVELVQHLHSLPHDKIGHSEHGAEFLSAFQVEEQQKEQQKEPRRSRRTREGEAEGAGGFAGLVDSCLDRIFRLSNVQSPPSEYTSAEATASAVIAEYPSLVGYTYTLVVEGVKRVLRVTQVIFRSDGLIEGIGRGTTVLEVKCIGEEVVETAQRTTVAPEESWKGQDLILKVSFPPSERTKESVLIDTARAQAETYNAHWALRHLPRVVASVDSLDWESNDPSENTLQKRLKSQFGDTYEMRSLRATVLEKLEPLSNLKSAREFAQVFYDILQIHRWLYEQPKILHRDLSMANIMFRREGDQVYGVLNDFDLSSLLTRMDKSPTSKHRTGTKPFMATDLLNTEWDKGHLYRHDLESLFYIILIVSCHYTGPTTRASSLPYEKWFNGVDEFIFALKSVSLQSVSPDLPVQTYFNGFTQWLLTIREMLDEGYRSRPGAPSRSVKKRIKALLYDWETLNGHVTYLQMMEVMRSFDGQELSTRWDGGGKRS